MERIQNYVGQKADVGNCCEGKRCVGSMESAKRKGSCGCDLSNNWEGLLGSLGAKEGKKALLRARRSRTEKDKWGKRYVRAPGCTDGVRRISRRFGKNTKKGRNPGWTLEGR